MTRRNLELALLCIAAPLVILLFAMIALGEGSSLSWENLGVPVGIFIAFLIAHLAIRKLAPGADPALLPLSFALSGIGIAFVTRLAPELAMRQVMFLTLSLWNEEKLPAVWSDPDLVSTIVLLVSLVLIKKKICGVIQTLVGSGLLSLALHFFIK